MHTAQASRKQSSLSGKEISVKTKSDQNSSFLQNQQVVEFIVAIVDVWKSVLTSVVFLAMVVHQNVVSL